MSDDKLSLEVDRCGSPHPGARGAPTLPLQGRVGGYSAASTRFLRLLRVSRSSTGFKNCPV